jgi:PTS system nitrogen regulatory IIA component
MKLTVEDVTKIFNVSEKTIYRWIKSNGLPAYRVNNQYRFNHTDLLEWASAHRVNLSPSEVQNNLGHPIETLPSFCEALTNGGIYYRVDGHDKPSVLKEIVGLLRLPDRIDRDLLVQMLIAREEMGSTAIGDGIAIPHARNPIVLNVTQPSITLCFLEQPIEFDAIDSKLVSILFTLITPTIQSHLHLLSRLAFVLRDAGFHSAVTQHAAREKILAEARRVEVSLSGETVGQIARQ